MMESKRLLNLAGGLPDLLMKRVPGFLVEKNRLPRDEYLERLAFYGRAGEDGAGLLRLPADAPEAEVTGSRPFLTGRAEIIRYPSRYRPLNPELQRDLDLHPENASGWLHLWRHEPEGQRPLALCVHGFRMGLPRRAEAMFRVKRLFELGLDTALCVLPLHWRRAPDPRKLYFLNPANLPLAVECFGQSIHDLHSAVLLLNGMGYGRIGVIGASLGGYVSALYATTAATADFIFMVVPAFDLWSTLKPRADLLGFPVDEEVTELSRKALDLASPLKKTPIFDPARISVVAHGGDRLCEVGHTRAWIEKAGVSNYVEVVGGHWLYFDHNARGDAWYGWLGKMGYVR
jgi:pimeloyl-ACP methyl ester carboxylesterase